jgi:hypothetical protein
MSINIEGESNEAICTASLTLIAAVLAGGGVHAAIYHYTDHWDYIRKPALGAGEFDARLQADAATCDAMVGAQHGAPTPGLRSMVWLAPSHLILPVVPICRNQHP